MRRKAIRGPPRLSHAATAARSLQPAPEEAPAHTGSPLASPLPSAKLQSTLALGPSRTPLALKPRQPAAPVPRAPSRPVLQVRRWSRHDHLDRRSSSPKTRMLEPPQRLAPTTLGRRSQTRFKARICQPSRVAPLTTDALTPPTVRLLPNRAGNASTPMLAIDRARNLSHPLPARKALPSRQTRLNPDVL